MLTSLKDCLAIMTCDGCGYSVELIIDPIRTVYWETTNYELGFLFHQMLEHEKGHEHQEGFRVEIQRPRTHFKI